MIRKIGFIGNCQLGTLSRIYKYILGNESGIDVFYTPSYQSTNLSQRNLIGSADVIVRQILDFDQKIGPLESDARELLFPHVAAPFLWPYTGQQHPLNAKYPYFDESGPYPAELGDFFLNKMVADKLAPAQAVEKYLKTDIAETKHLDRLAEVFLSKQRARDQSCGYNFADVIAADFRRRSLFRSPNHPDIPLMMTMAAQLFEQLGVDPCAIERVVAHPPDNIVPVTETPIHPSVARHFALTYAADTRRYRYFDEGSFTFAEYADRYMRFTWCPKIAEGMHKFRSGDMDGALPALEEGVPAAPRSAIARYVLSDLLAKKGRLVEAIQRARGAVALEPDNALYRDRLEHLLSHSPAPRTQSIQAPKVVPKEEAVLESNLTVEFGRSGNAAKYQGEGWGGTEADFDWTRGPRVSLRMGKVPTTAGYILTVSLAPFGLIERLSQRCSVLINDIPLTELEIDRAEEHSIWISAEVVAEAEGQMNLTFEISADAQPSKPLTKPPGLAFQRMTLDRLGVMGMA